MEESRGGRGEELRGGEERSQEGRRKGGGAEKDAWRRLGEEKRRRGGVERGRGEESGG